MLSKVKAIIKFKRNRASHRTQSKSSVDNNTTDDHQQREDNEEDVALVWLGKATPDPALIAKLRSTVDFIQISDAEDEALECQEAITNEKIIVILDYFSDHLLSVLQSLPQVHTVLLYTSTPPAELPTGVKAICKTEEVLLHEVQRTEHELRRQLVLFSIYNQKNREKHDLTRETGSFLFFQLFKAAFTNLPKSSESKRLFTTKCRQYYADNPRALKEIGDFEANYKSTEALEWYTKHSFVHRLLNKALRTENIQSLCALHFYIADLSKQLEKEMSKYRKQNSKASLTCYRALPITMEEIRHFQSNLGNLILTNGYLSATRQRQRACDLLIPPGSVKVVFEYAIDASAVKSIVFADISSYNPSVDDDEILFDIGTVFQLNSCAYVENEDLWIVRVSATDEGRNVASEYADYQKAKMAHSNIILMLGHLIIEIGDYDKAERYFQAILRSAIPNDEEISCIYYHLGRTYRLKGDHERALEYLHLAYRTHSEARPSRSVSAAKALNAIGIACQEQHQTQQAIDAFESVLKIYAKTIQGDHPDVAGTLINLGNVYCEQEQFEEAQFCFERARNIYEHSLPPNHPNIAVLLNNIGNLFCQQMKLNSAFEAYQRALNIYQKILPPNHPDVERNMHNLSKISVMIAEQNNEMPAPSYDSIKALAVGV